MDRSFAPSHSPSSSWHPPRLTIEEAVETMQFTALSPGIGLGRIRAKELPQSPGERLGAIAFARSSAPEAERGHLSSPFLQMPQSGTAKRPSNLSRASHHEVRRGPDMNSQRALTADTGRNLDARQNSSAISMLGAPPQVFAPEASQRFAQLAPQPSLMGSPAAHLPAGIRGRPSFSRRFFAWGLDFLFVTLSLATVLALTTLLIAIRSGETDHPLTLAPVQWLVHLNPYGVIAGVYAVFFAYGLLFKGLAGRTLAETLLRLPRGSQEKMSTP